jgi:phage-related protein
VVGYSEFDRLTRADVWAVLNYAADTVAHEEIVLSPAGWGVFLVADESCDFSVVVGARAAGHDVTAITETMSGAAEEQVIELADSQRRLLLTEDNDFGQLIAWHANRAHIRPLESKLWEMRLKGRDGIARAVYSAVHDRRLLVLHVFVKKTETTPPAAIEIALKRLKATK